MVEQPKKTKISNRKKSRVGIVLLGFACLFIAMAIVTVLTIGVVKNNQKNRVATVSITKSGFEPATLVVKQGTKITWTNNDTSLHQVASNPFPQDTGLPGLKSQILNNTQSYQYIANTAGTFGYHDQITPTINGTLVVQKQ